MKQITKVSDLVIANFTSAKLVVNQSVEISATPKKIWGVMSNQPIAGK